jgi:hypothetical protein
MRLFHGFLFEHLSVRQDDAQLVVQLVKQAMHLV